MQMAHNLVIEEIEGNAIIVTAGKRTAEFSLIECNGGIQIVRGNGLMKNSGLILLGSRQMNMHDRSSPKCIVEEKGIGP